jgi:L-lactate dehydrogenase complex protein LldG
MANSKDEILAAVEGNQPAFTQLPDIAVFKGTEDKPADKFTEVLTTIGGKVVPVKSLADVKNYISIHMNTGGRNITTIPLLADVLELITNEPADPHSLQNVDYAIIEAHFGVAENGALWVTEDLLKLRALPFICQYLAVLVNAGDIVPTMHEAYQRIGTNSYGFGTFIAGPSKTADIEQSLVLGAHGPRSMTVFLLDE